MIDKVIKLSNELEYCIIDQVIIDGKIYLFGVQVDNEQEIVTQNYIVLEVKFDNYKIIVDNINDKEKYEYISNLFVDRMKKNEQG